MKGASTDKPVVLVTGASAGIGEGIVRRFAAGGFRVVAVARRQERLAELAKALADVADVETVAVDVAQRDAGDRSVDAAMKRFGRLDRSEEHTSELQSLMRISYAVFCLKK